MNTMEKSVLLYEKMAERMKREGREKYQAGVYDKILEMMKKYDDMERFMEDLKNSSLYLAPSVALIKDKCAAYRDGAQENKMLDVAELYNKQIEKIEENQSAYMETGFYKEGAKLKEKYIKKMEAFSKIYENYYQIKICFAGNEGVHLKDLVEAFEELEKYNDLGEFSGDFAQVAKKSEYRNLIPESDQGYERFVEEAILFRTTAPNYNEEGQEIEKVISQAWEELNVAKKEVVESGMETKKKMKHALEIYIPPKDKEGVYEFALEEVRDYE